MNNIKIWSTCLLILLLHVSLSCAAHVLQVVPEKVELGTFNAFQIIETKVTLKNTGKETFLIDKIKANCSCTRTEISTKEIPPGKTIELKIAARETTGGKFSHDILIIPKDREHCEPLKIQTTGTVIQPVSAMIGLENEKLMTFDPNSKVNLGFVHHLSELKPIVYITADEKLFNLRDSVPDVNSVIFELLNYKFEKVPESNQIQTSESQKERLVLSLKPKKALKVGTLKDYVTIQLADNVGLEIPILCRIIGDVYSEEKMIHFGNLSAGSPRKFTIHFTNNAEVWPDLKWEINGYLSDAIVISEDDIERTNSYIEITLNVDKLKLNSIPSGYVFCRFKFFRSQPTDNDVINILADGFKKKSEI